MAWDRNDARDSAPVAGPSPRRSRLPRLTSPPPHPLKPPSGPDPPRVSPRGLTISSARRPVRHATRTDCRGDVALPARAPPPGLVHRGRDPRGRERRGGAGGLHVRRRHRPRLPGDNDEDAVVAPRPPSPHPPAARREGEQCATRERLRARGRRWLRVRARASCVSRASRASTRQLLAGTNTPCGVV